MEDREDDLMKSDSSDSDDHLDVPEFSKIFAPKSKVTPSSNEYKNKYPSSRRTNRLDNLLSDHVKEAAERTRLEKVREQLQQDIKEHDSQGEHESNSQSLASEHEDHLQQLDVKSSEPLLQPGIKVFHQEQFCCLYTIQTSPFACGFTPSGSSIDKILASTTPETLTNLLLSKALVACVEQVSDIDSVLLWLLNLLAIHPSPVTSHSCYINLTGILHQFKVELLSSKNPAYHSWCPHPLSLLRIFINLGAKPEDLLGNYHIYPEDEIRKFLAEENDENNDHQDVVKGSLSKENIQLVLKVLATALQTQMCVPKESLNQMFFMIAKVQLDSNVNKFISLEAQECFGAILQCYRDTDWLSVRDGTDKGLVGADGIQRDGTDKGLVGADGIQRDGTDKGLVGADGIQRDGTDKGLVGADGIQRDGTDKGLVGADGIQRDGTDKGLVGADGIQRDGTDKGLVGADGIQRDGTDKGLVEVSNLCGCVCVGEGRSFSRAAF
ncbi:hypothetical protein RRG08_026989 [Elysia crispata]|uniref:Coiled-coil SMC6 And NSE5 INteracting (CANIN) domain-containing protein n=1 Tax=Elysia crispata TaxID=231223 RepID=A0AAE1AHW5_9GAST|nr:hypothetical protein RRG08_026989 [Elysia crispata]